MEKLREMKTNIKRLISLVKWNRSTKTHTYLWDIRKNIKIS